VEQGVDGLARRLRQTGYAAAQVLLFVPVLLVLLLVVLSAVLVVVWVGIALLFVAIPTGRLLAGLHRRMAADVLAEPVPARYRDTRGLDPLRRLTCWAGDPATGRDQAWAAYSCTLGFVLSLLVVLLAVGVVTWPLWWYAAGPAMRARSVLDRVLLSRSQTEVLEQRVRELRRSREVSVDHAAAELRRIERDLHDGAQARLVALGMSLGMAEEVMAADPEAARRLLDEARSTTSAALGDLRSVVQGIHPPVLADRGLVGAVEALAVDLPFPVDVEADVPGRAPAPVESAVYFAVAECLANAAKHARASRAWVELRHADGVLAARVGDDGAGGADVDAGSGLRGVSRRLQAFDGTMRLSSPAGGPTTITLEVPCALSSGRTTPSSGRG
jgi:signal transduction histidine kinase